MHKCHLVIDLQFGSTGKGLLAGYLAKREKYDTVVCSFATNAGHTYIDDERKLHVMTQQLPTGITSPTVKNVLLGPGALIDVDVLMGELQRYSAQMEGKRLLIHPHAAIVAPWHRDQEIKQGMSKIGSTTKGVGAAMIQRIQRDPSNMNIAGALEHWPVLEDFVVSTDEYREVLERSEACLVEGAQGYSLSMYHGFYPYTTSRDVTPWQIAADCALPYKWAPYIQIMGTLRAYPIRVNNRDGSSGPCYPDQREMKWEELGIPAELTTVTKLPRRIFTFSQTQLDEALFHCGNYWETKLFLNFANYMSPASLRKLVTSIETPSVSRLNPPKVSWVGFGPDDCEVMSRSAYDSLNCVGITDGEGDIPD